MAPRYRVTLTIQERGELESMTRSGKIPAKKFMYARALLLCDASELGTAWKVANVAEALGVTTPTIEHLKKRFVEEGLESTLTRKPSSTLGKRPSTGPSAPDGSGLFRAARGAKPLDPEASGRQGR